LCSPLLARIQRQFRQNPFTTWSVLIKSPVPHSLPGDVSQSPGLISARILLLWCHSYFWL
jgi:hypothetical protein